FLGVVERRDGGGDGVPVAEIVPDRKEPSAASIAATVDPDHTALIAALQGAGENVQLGIALAKIFEGDLDFASDVQLGDRFEIVFEKVTREGAYAGYGDILGAIVEHDGRRLTALRVESGDGRAGDYGARGRALTRA